MMTIYWTIVEKVQKELKGYSDCELELVEVFQPTDVYFKTEESALETVENWLKLENDTNEAKRRGILKRPLETSEYSIIKVYTNVLHLDVNA